MADGGQVTPIRQGAADAVKQASGRAGSARGVKAPVSSSVLGPQETSYGAIKRLFNSYQPLGYFLPWEILDYVELLSTYNPDYSQAVENIVTLANSGHELFVEASSELEVRRSKEHLELMARTVQPSHGGIDGLIDKLLDQAATYGAMCGEWLLNEELTEVIGFADINPKNIRYFWDEDELRYVPFQKVSQAVVTEREKAGQEVKNGCIRLNETTFHYYAFDPEPESPYGTPPFIAALLNIGIQKDMIANMSQIVKKVGLLGIIDVSVEQLQPLPGETDEAFAARATAFLEEYVTAAEEMVRDGGLVHFNDVEVKTSSVAGNAAGATNIFKQNEELIFSGLKSMPSVQGRSYSTTETYAGVAYDIIIRNTKKYQKAIKRMIEAGYWLSVSLAGRNPSKISIKFNENKTLHRLQDAQAEAVEIKNGLILWEAGIIDQLMFAQRLGYSGVKRQFDEVPDSSLIGSAGDLNSGGNEAGDNQSLDDTGGGKADNRNNSMALRDAGLDAEELEEVLDQLP